MARYKSKGIRGNWSEASMKQALTAIKSGSMKVYTAAKHYNVPRRTLRRYLLEKKETKSTLGRKPLLNSEQEKILASRIIRLCNVGYPLTQRALRRCVKTFCDRNNISASDGDSMVGRDWLRGFLKRHRNISKRKAQHLNPARAQKLNKTVVSDYFAKLKKILEDNDIMNKPERIFNIDEKGCQLTLHKSPEVLAERGSKRVHLVASEHGENVTIVSCGNALGHAIPPMILFKGKRMKPEWIDSLPTSSIAQMTPKGSMNSETFVSWMHHFSKFKLPGPCLLIFDGAKCHLDYSIVEAAEKFDIKPFCLPSNTTHELQPMDKAVFRSFEYYWDEEVLKYWSLHEDRKITKQRFGILFSKAWDKAATPANIKSGFEATGIFPFNPERIPEEVYAPSIPTFDSTIPRPSQNEENNDSNDSDNTSENLSIPPQENDDPIESNDTVAGKNLVILAQVNDNPNDSTAIDFSGNHFIPVENPMPILHPDQNDSQTSERILPNTANRSDNNSKHPTQVDRSKFIEPQPSVYDDFDSSDEIPLSKLKQHKNNRDLKTESKVCSTTLNESYSSFCGILKTPEKTSSPKTKARAKAINSLAQELTKSMFKEKNNKPEPSNASKQKIENKPGPSRVSSQKRKQYSPEMNKTTAVTSKVSNQKGKGHSKKSKNSWYCYVCGEDRIADMRLCFLCQTYVHEECVGLTKRDTDKFVCTLCSQD
ncbi:unnamed protein product [Callosobruchus maculatus]|uniref:HTH CENPB-type domain-containing protein n=1 Tax=Callosobruchus maculatus TaxID=64391 RepID=A0A653CGQ8_CALMS|nr:unnamed protein product [Callosobruchus maculatus]